MNHNINEKCEKSHPFCKFNQMNIIFFLHFLNCATPDGTWETGQKSGEPVSRFIRDSVNIHCVKINWSFQGLKNQVNWIASSDIIFYDVQSLTLGSSFGWHWRLSLISIEGIYRYIQATLYFDFTFVDQAMIEREFSFGVFIGQRIKI